MYHERESEFEEEAVNEFAPREVIATIDVFSVPPEFMEDTDKLHPEQLLHLPLDVAQWAEEKKKWTL
jgi:hypothetical protein